MITSMPWGLRNRFNGGWAQQYGQHWYMHGGGSVHTFHWLVPPATYFDTNPEYYSLIGDQRQWENAQLCLSNPEVAQVAAKTAIASLRGAGPTRRMIDVSPMDWTGHCECKNCRAVEEATGGYSGLLLTFVNRVAELVQTEVPDATVTTLAYWDSNRPPITDIKARDNVRVRFCPDWGASFTWPYHSFYDDRLAKPPATPGNRWVEQRQAYQRWQEISPRMHLWMYPSQYRHTYAPMPNIRAVAENIRYFAGQQAESVYIQFGGSDRPSEAMRNWVFAKLLWNPTLDVDDLIQDFLWGSYGNAAPAVLDYYRLLWDHCARYTDFGRQRDWIHAIHEEAMFRHGFGEQARAILARAETAADTESVRRQVGLLKLGVVYVEAAQMFMQMRDGQTPPDMERYDGIVSELDGLCQSLDVHDLGFYDGSRTIGPAADFLDEMRTVRERRFDQRHLATFKDACDGAVLHETFANVADGQIPATWRRRVQEHNGRPCGLAQVSRHFVGTPTLHLRDQRSHVAVWSASDEVLPAGKQWAVQFDFRLTGELIYKATDEGPYQAADAGAAFGLKRGQPGSTGFLPLVQFDNGEAAAKPVTMLGLGQVLATGLAANQWHRLVIHREGTTWHFYLNGERKKTVVGRDTDLRGIAFGSFRNWPHVAQDIHYANLKIGNFVDSEISRPGS